MRVLSSTYGARRDVEPVVGLAVEPVARGAKVRLCAPPGEELAALPDGARTVAAAVRTHGDPFAADRLLEGTR